MIAGVEAVDAFKTIAPFLATMVKRELILFITDREVMRFVLSPESVKVFNEGDRIIKGGAADRCMERGEPVEATLTKEQAGIALRSVFIPVADPQGDIIAAIGVSVNRERETILMGMAQDLSATSQQMQASVQELAAGAEVMRQTYASSIEEIQALIGEVESIAALGELVESISAESRLLGLNATIEAARAGEAGKTFAVVAQEIRKMAEKSEEIMREIKRQLAKVKDNAFIVVNSMAEVGNRVDSQVNATQEMANAQEQLTNIAINLSARASEI